MIIGKNKGKVIDNIKKAIETEEYNKKVEVDDPNLTTEEKDEIIKKYLLNKDKTSFKIKTKIDKAMITFFTNILNKDTKIEGTQNIENIKCGGIITSNHFNPIDNLIIQKFAKKVCKKRLYIVSQETNLAMTGVIGFFMKYSDTIPVSGQLNYMKKDFPKIIKKVLSENNLILIYPEQEMWFNYKKPRPPKEGAYYFAAKNNVPILSCFVEMKETNESDNKEFNKVKYVLHILKPIYPDSKKTAKENSIIMKDMDYKQKVEAYEKVYNKKLDYKFETGDIAGWKNN